jgi:hypothetical protein
MKGQLDLPIISIIVGLVIVLGFMANLKLLKIPLVNIIQYEMSHDNSQLIIFSLLSSTKDSKTIQESIGESIVLGNPRRSELEKIIKNRLDKITDERCYELLIDSKTWVKSSGCKPKDYEKETFIPLPYNGGDLVKKLTLVID